MTKSNHPSHQQLLDDLRAEGQELHQLLLQLDANDWETATGFKGWTPNDVVAHLHFSDYMGLTSLRSSADFKFLMRHMRDAKQPLMDYTHRWLNGESGQSLLQRWYKSFQSMCDEFAAADPDTRLTWVGPDMGLRMFITARQMETWAHGWEIYDLKGVSRQHTDRIKNIATIGVKTYKFTFANRKLSPPGPAPQVQLQAPSGAIWRWNEDNADVLVQGDAVEFCQVVTQVRNLADTRLKVTGTAAQQWMAIAQCFAGGPQNPPKPGTRGPFTG